MIPNLYLFIVLSVLLSFIVHCFFFRVHVHWCSLLPDCTCSKLRIASGDRGHKVAPNLIMSAAVTAPHVTA